MIKKEDILVLDTETTGLRPISRDPAALHRKWTGRDRDERIFPPCRRTCWPGAEAVNHISPAMVAGKPLISERKLGIEKILHAAKIISGYNLPYDQKMLIQNGIYIPSRSKVRYLDLMKPFAKTYGEPSSRYPGKYKYQKLITCAKYYGYSEEGWHDSLADTKATLYCFWKMVEDGSICIE